MSEQGGEGGDRVKVTARLDRGRWRAARMYAAETDVTVQDVLDAALDEYLTARER